MRDHATVRHAESVITSTWKSVDADIEAFLTNYEKFGDTPGAGAATPFAEQFIATDPQQATVVSPEMLIASLPARRKMFEQAGIGKIRRVGAAQLDLDAHHSLVNTEWEADRWGGDPLRLESTFLLRRAADGPRILVYLNHHDITALLAGVQKRGGR